MTEMHPNCVAMTAAQHKSTNAWIEYTTTEAQAKKKYLAERNEAENVISELLEKYSDKAIKVFNQRKFLYKDYFTVSLNVTMFGIEIEYTILEMGVMDIKLITITWEELDA